MRGPVALCPHTHARPLTTPLSDPPPPSHPFCYFPVLYLTKGAFEGRPVASTWEKYKADLWDNCKALWTIWVPAQLVNFAFMPRHLRIPYGERRGWRGSRRMWAAARAGLGVGDGCCVPYGGERPGGACDGAGGGQREC